MSGVSRVTRVVEAGEAGESDMACLLEKDEKVYIKNEQSATGLRKVGRSEDGTPYNIAGIAGIVELTGG